MNKVQKGCMFFQDREIFFGDYILSLPFDQVIDTVYSNYDPELLSVTDQEIDMATITEEAINKVLELRQY